MAKKKEVDEVDAGEASATGQPLAVDGLVYVNQDKLNRAKEILALVQGKSAPRTDSDADRKERFAGHFAAHEMDPKHKDALRFVYETLLGGLVRTQDEQADADADAAKAKAKLKKKPLGE